jgi:hypothetical protein
MINRVSAPGLSARNYWNRYTEDALDLCDALGYFMPNAKTSLNDLCRALGFHLDQFSLGPLCDAWRSKAADDPDTLDALCDQSADTNDPMEDQFRKFLAQLLACASLIGFVKSIDTGDAGEVRDCFKVPDHDVIEGALHQSREAQIGSSSTVFTIGSKPLVYCYASANRGAHTKQKGERQCVKSLLISSNCPPTWLRPTCPTTLLPEPISRP